MKTEEAGCEARVRVRGPVDLVVPGIKLIPATVCEVSASGLCLEASVPVDPGTAVRLETGGAVSEGVVASCEGKNLPYRIVVVLEPLGAA